MFLQSYRKPECLDPREALFGGCTNMLKLYHQVADGERVRYYDFTSLYPAVNSQNQYLIGHPQIIYRDFPLISISALWSAMCLLREGYSILSCPIGVTKNSCSHYVEYVPRSWTRPASAHIATKTSSCQVCGSRLSFKRQLKKATRSWTLMRYGISQTKQTPCSRTMSRPFSNVSRRRPAIQDMSKRQRKKRNTMSISKKRASS